MQKIIRITSDGKVMRRVAIVHRRRSDGMPYVRYVWTYAR